MQYHEILMETQSHINKHLNVSTVTEKKQKEKLDNNSCLFVCQLQDNINLYLNSRYFEDTQNLTTMKGHKTSVIKDQDFMSHSPNQMHKKSFISI